MKIGSQAGKRKLTVFYLIPTDGLNAEGFPVVITSRGAIIELAKILTSGRVDYKTGKFSFTLRPFTYRKDINGYELELTAQLAQPKASCMASLGGVSQRRSKTLLPTIFQFASYGAWLIAFFRRSF